MRYTINEGPNKGKNINIPDEYIQRTQRSLDCDLTETINLYLSDEGLLENEIVQELTAKAKTAGVGAKATGEKKERKAPERKPDFVKRAVIGSLTEYINSVDGVSDCTVTNIERMISFALGGDNYEVTLTKKRKPKK